MRDDATGLDMAYKGYRPDLLVRVEKAIGELTDSEAWAYHKWYDAKDVSDWLGESLRQTIECIDRLATMGHLEVHRDGDIVSYRIVNGTLLMVGEYKPKKPKVVRKCHKCGKPIKRRHNRKGAHPDHECKLEVIKKIMDQ